MCMIVGLVLACLRIEAGWLLELPFAAWFVRLLWRSPRWRQRALDDLEERAPSMSLSEREVDIDIILRLYGGRPFPKVKRRVESIRSLPTRGEPVAS
jgi:hypothetical protein